MLGPLSNRLSNAGERLRLRNNDGRIIDQVTYGVEGDWPVAPDGAGPSLARLRANIRGAEPKNWSASAQNGGTPGAREFSVNAANGRSVTSSSRSTDTWRFNDSGIEPPAAWRTRAYDDSAWANGTALFFREDAPLPAAKNTALAAGRTTYYFRKSFVLTGEVDRAQLLLRPIIDDGAIAYLNGAEVLRVNMPAGAVNYSTLASGEVGDASIGDSSYILSESLVPGTECARGGGAPGTLVQRVLACDHERRSDRLLAARRTVRPRYGFCSRSAERKTGRMRVSPHRASANPARARPTSLLRDRLPGSRRTTRRRASPATATSEMTA